MTKPAAKPKQLNLKDGETYELASTVARLHGISRTAAVKVALEEKLKRDVAVTDREQRLERINALVESYAGRIGPRLMSDENAIGYDEFGLPK